MPHSPLISTIVAGLVLAFVLGAVANRLRVSPLVGYLLAGVAVGPYTPGFVADQALARDLADIGVILLMFGVGLQFSPKELLAVRTTAVPGAVIQITGTTAAGMALAWALGWPPGTGFVFGLALSIASTVVVIRVLDERRILNTTVGRISVGWLIAEDLILILVMVVLPTLAPALGAGAASADMADLPVSEMLTAVGLVVGKALLFIAAMLLLGQRLIPALLHHIAHTGSRELFRLGIFALALGVAFASAELVGVSFALGAFIAGLVLSESELSQRATVEALPLRDAFAVLFFVSVGMLFDPAIFIREPWPVIGVLFIIMVLKPAATYATMRAFGQAADDALTLAACRTQIGEFSFILAGLGVVLGVLPEAGQDLILAGAMISIVATPAFFGALDRISPRRTDQPPAAAGAGPGGAPAGEAAAAERASPTDLVDHTVVVGAGRVGSVICEALHEQHEAFLVIEERRDLLDPLRESGFEVIYGHAPAADVMKAANLAGARRLFIAIPDGFEAGQISEQARATNPDLQIIARAHSDAEADHLRKYGADVTIMAEQELATAMLAQGTMARHGAEEARPETATPRSAEPGD